MIPFAEDRKVLKAINGLLILLIVISLLSLVRGVLSSGLREERSRLAEGESPEGTGEIQPEGKERFNSAAFVQRNLFGVSGNPSYKQKGYLQTDTNIKGALKLVGTIAAGNGGGYAFFVDSEGKQTFVRRGEEIAPGEILSRVDWGSVEITGGKRYSLPLIKITDRTQNDVQGRSARFKPTKYARGIRRASEGEYIVDRQQVEEAINNPQNLMTDARLQPIIRGGKQEGFVLKEVRRNGIYHTLGLRNNDVLLRINNYPITDPEAALQAFTALRGADEIVLNIKRNGRRKTLRYHIR